MALPKSDLMSLADLQSQFFSLSKAKSFSERRVHRCDYINKQLQSSLIKRQLEGRKCILTRLKTIGEQEEKLPLIKEAAGQIKDIYLQRIFVKQFQKPTVDKLNRELELAEENKAKRKEVIELELKYLKEIAKLMSAGNVWLLHFRLMILIQQLQNPSGQDYSKQKSQESQLQEMMVLTPWESADFIRSFLQMSSTSHNFELNFGSSSNFLLQMHKLNVKEQVRRRNAIILRENLSQQKTTFQQIKIKTAALEKNLTAEIEQLEKDAPEKILQPPKKIQESVVTVKAKKLDSLAAVDCLVETLMKHHAMQPTEMAKILEQKTQTLINEVSNLRREISNVPQITLEKKYLAMEHAKLKYEESSIAYKKRSEKLLRKFQIALLPPSSRTFKPIEKFQRKEKRKALTVIEQVDQGQLEELTCFDAEVTKPWVVQNYKPAAQIVEKESGQDMLQMQWQAGKRNALR